MKVVWTRQAAEGWQEVAEYILEEFGQTALLDFQQRTKDEEDSIAFMPPIGSIEWDDSDNNTIYRYRIIYRRSKMLYFVENDTVFIADFWDVRKNK